MDPQAQAMQRLQAKRRFQRHALIYAVVIGLLVVIWALTNFRNYFWPVWPALLWGIALAIHAWTVFGQRPITDADIDRELGRGRGRRPGCASVAPGVLRLATRMWPGSHGRRAVPGRVSAGQRLQPAVDSNPPDPDQRVRRAGKPGGRRRQGSAHDVALPWGCFLPRHEGASEPD